MHPRSISRSSFAPSRYGRPQYQPLSSVGAFDAFQFDGETPLSAQARLVADFDGPEDRQLADDIARVMQHRPLMSRLARVEASHSEAAGFVAKASPPSVAAPAAEPSEKSAELRSIEEVIDDLPNVVSSPASARWLEKARQDHLRERNRHAIAWVTTLGIACAIITATLVLLRV